MYDVAHMNWPHSSGRVTKSGRLRHVDYLEQRSFKTLEDDLLVFGGKLDYCCRLWAIATNKACILSWDVVSNW
jgi:hypothetical protein